MNGWWVLGLTVFITVPMLGWSALMDYLAQRQMRRAPIAASQRFRREHVHELPGFEATYDDLPQPRKKP